MGAVAGARGGPDNPNESHSMTVTRQDYISGKATHEQYYAQFVTPAVVRVVVAHIGQDKLRLSTDPDMNDIPLQRWDRLHETLRAMCDAKVRETDGGGYALMHTVCIAKAAARQWLAEGQ